jgi:uncharacterized damage-inducible protein DinB
MSDREIRRLEDQLRRAFEGEAWHGPSVMEVLADVTAQEACERPVAGAHSIWELVLHIAATYGLMNRRMRGNHEPPTPEQDWPPQPDDPSAQEWLVTLNGLRSGHQDLRRAVAGLTAEKLDQPLGPGSGDPAYVQFIGLTQHDLYHAGQIALLKKALREAVQTSNR